MQSTLLDPRLKKQGFPKYGRYQIAYQSLSRKVQRISVGQDYLDPEATVNNSPLSIPATI